QVAQQLRKTRNALDHSEVFGKPVQLQIRVRTTLLPSLRQPMWLRSRWGSRDPIAEGGDQISSVVACSSGVEPSHHAWGPTLIPRLLLHPGEIRSPAKLPSFSVCRRDVPCDAEMGSPRLRGDEGEG